METDKVAYRQKCLAKCTAANVHSVRCALGRLQSCWYLQDINKGDIEIDTEEKRTMLELQNILGVEPIYDKEEIAT